MAFTRIKDSPLFPCTLSTFIKLHFIAYSKNSSHRPFGTTSKFDNTKSYTESIKMLDFWSPYNYIYLKCARCFHILALRCRNATKTTPKPNIIFRNASRKTKTCHKHMYILRYAISNRRALSSPDTLRKMKLTTNELQK